jgi:hypothetical protein
MTERVPSRTRTRRMGSLDTTDTTAPSAPASRLHRRATERLWGAVPLASQSATQRSQTREADTTDRPDDDAASRPAATASAPPPALPGSARTFPKPTAREGAWTPGLVLRVIDGVRRVTLQRPVVSNRSVPTVLGLRPVPLAPGPAGRGRGLASWGVVDWAIVGWALVAASMILGGAWYLTHG